MKNATTDAELSLAANEFLWRADGLTEAHAYLLPTVRDWLEDGEVGSVLDIGCGNGAFTHHLARAGFDVSGMDSSESGIEVAGESYPDIGFLMGSVDSPLPAELRQSFDAVIAVEVIEHLLLPRHLFERAAEALRPGGSFIVTTPFHGYWKNLALALAGKFDEHWHPLRDYGHVKFFSVKTLARLFDEQGFRVRRVKRAGRIPALAKSMIVEGIWNP